MASAFSGPASATDNAILRFDGTTGKLGKNSSASIDDNGVVSAAGAILDTAANSLDQGLVTSHSGTGSPGARFDFNLFTVTADDIATDEGDDTVSVHRIVHSFGGSNAKGARETLRVEALLTDPTSASNGNRNYVAGRFDARASAADNGSLPGSPAGALFALNPVAHLSADATGWLEVNGGEVNVGMDSGASVSRRIGWSLVSYGVGNGSFDSALNIGAFSDSVGWGTGINFSDGNGGAPLPSNGTLIASTGSWTVGNGIELSTLDITGNLIRGKGLVTIMGSTSGQVAIGVDDTTGTYVFSLPTSAGTAGYPLLSGGGSTVQTYGILGVAAGGTGDSGTDWSSMGTLSLLAGSGSFGSASAAGWYKQLGKSVLFTIRVDVASIGSAASYFTVGIPWTAKRYLSLSAANPSINNLMCATISDGATSITVTNFNNTSIGIGSGQFVVITGIAVID